MLLNYLDRQIKKQGHDFSKNAVRENPRTKISLKFFLTEFGKLATPISENNSFKGCTTKIGIEGVLNSQRFKDRFIKSFAYVLKK